MHSVFHIELICAQKLYESIRNEPFKIPEDDGNDLTHTFFNPDREGWLLKLGTLINFYLTFIQIDTKLFNFWFFLFCLSFRRPCQDVEEEMVHFDW